MPDRAPATALPFIKREPPRGAQWDASALRMSGLEIMRAQLKVNFLRPVVPHQGDLLARARIVHRGRTIAVATCEIVNAEGKTVAMATASVLILPGRPWDRPVYVEDELTSAGGA